MSEELKEGQEPSEPKGQEPLSAEDLKKELEATRKEAAKYRTKAKSLEDAQAKAAEEVAKKNGEFERLYGEAKAKAEALEAEVAAVRAAREAELAEVLKELDEDAKEIVEATIPEKRLAVARKLAAKKDSKVGTTNSAGGRGGQYGGHSDELSFAKADPDGYIKWKYGDKPRR